MADEQQVRAAVTEVVSRLDELDEGTRRKIPDRSISALVTDVDLAWTGHFVGGHLRDVEEIDPSVARDAAFKLKLDSDTLLELVDGQVGFAHAWSRGRVRVDAGFRDILALRSFL